MEKNYEKMVTDLLHHLVRRFNEYSELVALNYYRNHDKNSIQWNRGHEDTYEDEAKDLADKLGRKINYELRKSKYFEETPEEFEIEYRAMYVTF